MTNGHLDIIARGSRLFDKVIVAILENPEKSPLLTLAERRQLILASTANLPNVEVDSFEGLLADYARSQEARVIVRGLRAISDFEYEFQMALMNQRLNSDMETVFMAPRESYSYLSSRLVKEVVALGGSVSGLVPKAVEKLITARVHRKRSVSSGRFRAPKILDPAPGGEGSAVGAHGDASLRRRRPAARRGGGGGAARKGGSR